MADNSPRSKDTFKGYSTNTNTPTRRQNRLKEKVNLNTFNHKKDEVAPPK